MIVGRNQSAKKRLLATVVDAEKKHSRPRGREKKVDRQNDTNFGVRRRKVVGLQNKRLRKAAEEKTLWFRTRD